MDLLRFEADLEFVQSLSNPQYLNCIYLIVQFLTSVLAQSKYFEDEAFMNYLAYLEYFRNREYAKFITYPLPLSTQLTAYRYPACLHILTLLKQGEFRDAITRGDIAKRLADEIFEHFTKGSGTDEAEGNGEITI
jgi:mediator of RNA polymerase II transcription subunit 31